MPVTFALCLTYSGILSLILGGWGPFCLAPRRCPHRHFPRLSCISHPIPHHLLREACETQAHLRGHPPRNHQDILHHWFPFYLAPLMFAFARWSIPLDGSTTFSRITFAKNALRKASTKALRKASTKLWRKP